MSDDDLRIRSKLNSTAENKTIKPDKEENGAGEVKAAEIQVGQEFVKSSDETSDVKFGQTDKKRMEQKQSEELAMLADIENMAIIPDDNFITQNAESETKAILAANKILQKHNPGLDLDNLSEKQKALFEVLKEYTLNTSMFADNLDAAGKMNYENFISHYFSYIALADTLNKYDFAKLLNTVQELLNADNLSKNFTPKSYLEGKFDEIDDDLSNKLEYTLKTKLENSPDKEKIFERLGKLPKNKLEIVYNDKNLFRILEANDLPATFENISNILEIVYAGYDISLRNTEEKEANKANIEAIKNRITAADIMENLFATISGLSNQYTDNLGLVGLAAEGYEYNPSRKENKTASVIKYATTPYLEGLKLFLNHGKSDIEKNMNRFQYANYMQECAERAGKLKPFDNEKFKEGFKNILGEYSKEFGINYDEKAFVNLVEIINNKKAQNPDGSFTKEYTEAINKALNFIPYNPNDDTARKYTYGFGEAVLMIVSLGQSTKLKGAQVATQATIKAFSKAGVKIAQREAKNALVKGAYRMAGKGVSLMAPMTIEGTKMAGYTLLTGSASNFANRTVKGDWENFGKVQSAIFDATGSSFEFGAFAGWFGSVITSRVTQLASKSSEKVAIALSDKFAKGAVDANEVYAAILEKSIPTKVAELSAFATDVIGFTGFEVANKIVEVAMNDNKDITVDEVTNLLYEEFKGQGYNLGQIKGVSYLLMWINGSRSARLAMSKAMSENIPALNGIKVEQKGSGYSLNLPDGRKIECKNMSDVISAHQRIVTGQTSFDKRFDMPKEMQETLKKLQTISESKQPTSISKLKKSSVATPEDLKAVQKIDRENFAGHYEIEDNAAEYIGHLAEEQITTRVFKDAAGKIVGYYQLEAIKDGELYIYSIGVPKDLKNSRESYRVLKSMQEEITNFAKDNKIKKVALDVDADNQALVKLYKKFGFEITGENSGIEDGNRYHDYHMEIDVEKTLSNNNGKPEPAKTTDIKADKEESSKISGQEQAEQTQNIERNSHAEITDTFFEKLPEKFADLKYLLSENKEIQKMQMELIQKFSEKSKGYYSENLADILRKTTLDEKIAKLQLNWIMSVLKADGITWLLTDKVTKMFKENPNIAQMQGQLLDKLLKSRPDVKPHEWANIVSSVNDNEDIAKIQLQLTDKVLQTYPSFDEAKLYDALLNISGDLEIAKMQLEWASKKLENRPELKNVTNVISTLSSDKTVAKMQLEWADKVFDKHPIGISLLSMSSDENIAKMELKWLDDLFNKYPDISSSIPSSVFSAIRHGKNPDDVKRVEIILNFAGKILDKQQDITVLKLENLENLIRYLHSSPEIAKLEADWMQQHLKDCEDRSLSRAIFSGISDNIDVAKLQFEWIDKLIKPEYKEVEMPMFSGKTMKTQMLMPKFKDYERIDTVLSSMKGDVFASKMQLEFADKINAHTRIDSQTLKSILLTMSKDKDIAQIHLDLLSKIIEKNIISNQDIPSFILDGKIPVIFKTIRTNKEAAKIQFDIISRFLDVTPVENHHFIDLLTTLHTSIKNNKNIAQIQQDIFNKYLLLSGKVNVKMIENISNTEFAAETQRELFIKLLKNYGIEFSEDGSSIKSPEITNKRAGLFVLTNFDHSNPAKLALAQKLCEQDSAILDAPGLSDNALSIYREKLSQKVENEYKNMLTDMYISLCCTQDNSFLKLQMDFVDKFIEKRDMNNETHTKLNAILSAIYNRRVQSEDMQKIFDLYAQDEIIDEAVSLVISGQIDFENYMTLSKAAGKEKISKYAKANSLTNACNMLELYKVNDLSDLPFEAKETLLKKLIQLDTPFEVREKLLKIVSEDAKANINVLREDFPLLPYSKTDQNKFITDVISSLAKESKAYRDLKDTVEYLLKNASKLQQADMPTLKEGDVTSLLLSVNFERTMDLINLGCTDVLKKAIELKYNGYFEFMKNSKFIEDLSPEIRALLKEKLAELKQPEQKLEKMQILAGISESAKDSQQINELIKDIKSPKVTEEQQNLADSIFATNKPYSEQIEDFIREFNVPEKNQAIIRDYLTEAKLNEKLLFPKTIEKQVERLQNMIKSVENSTKIPADRKAKNLQTLKQQLKNLQEHPDKYIKPKLTENAFKPLAQQIEAYINLPNVQAEFNAKINKMIYAVLNVTPSQELLESIRFDNKYVARLMHPYSANSKELIAKLMNLLKENPNKKLTEIYEQIIENRETRKLFKENGLDYDKWIKFDKDLSHPFSVKVDVENSVKSAREHLIIEFSSEVAKKINPDELAKLNKILQEHNISEAGQKELPKIIEAIEKEFESNDYWKSDDADIMMFKDHIRIHKKNIQAIEKLKNTEEELFVRLWDNDDVGRNIFFGNHVGCCTSIGNGNDFAAPQHLMNSFVNGIEIVDRGGNSLGNSMCYFAKVDGELTFIIDSFEASGKLGAAKEVTDALINYAKQVCEKMGRPDANIMFGPNYNKVNLDRCLRTDNHTVEVIGRAPEETYIDCIGGHGDINKPAKGRRMYEIPDL